VAELDPLQMILDGQKELTREVKGLTVSVTTLKTKVEGWDEQRTTAQAAHDRCREEQDKRWREHANDHTDLDKRIKPLEDREIEETGSSKGRSAIWKTIVAAISAAYLILSAVAIFNHW
jgi:chromosome segregation ATPase